MILKEGQKIIAEDGSVYLIEKGDSIKQLKESARDNAIEKCADDILSYAAITSYKAARKIGIVDESDNLMDFQMSVYAAIVDALEL